MFTWLIILLFMGMFFLIYRLKIQEERLRVLMAFVAGLFSQSVLITKILNKKNTHTPTELFKDSSEYKEIRERV